MNPLLQLKSSIHTLRTTVPNKLIEREEFYSRVDHPQQKHFETFVSEDVNGDIAHPFLDGKNNKLIRGFKSKSTGAKISFLGSNNIVFLGPHSRFNNASIRITASNSIFYFGAFSTVESLTAILSGTDGKIEFGDHCMLSARIIVDRSDHHSIYDASTGLKINFDQDVVVSDHVWIGRDVRISKGSRIGSDTVIGQAALISGELSAGCAYGGVPARCLRENITWSRMSSPSVHEMTETDRHDRFLKAVEAVKARM